MLAHNNPSERQRNISWRRCRSSKALLPADTEAQGTKSTVIVVVGETTAPRRTHWGPRSFRVTAVRPSANATRWCCLCSRQRWRPNQLWQKFSGWLLVPVQSGTVRGSTAAPAGDARSLQADAQCGCSPRGRGVSLLHCKHYLASASEQPSSCSVWPLSAKTFFFFTLFIRFLFLNVSVYTSTQREQLLMQSSYNIKNMKNFPIQCNNNAAIIFMKYRFVLSQRYIFPLSYSFGLTNSKDKNI